MTKQRKAVDALLGQGVITFAALTRALKSLGYELDERGVGSRVCYQRIREDGTLHKIRLHKPHPGNDVKHYAKRLVVEALQQEGLL